ncbi:MAG: hypothetical protein JST42_23995 [Bacteroidetes bacterium]|nr:hypothetical protein [Bacteroidota bacterium]
MQKIITILAVLLSTAALAQNDSASHFIVAATYNSGLNYYGRVDSLHSKGYYPSVGFSLKNGLYATSTFVFIQNSMVNEYAATLVEGGYSFGNKHWAGSLSASRYFYKADVSLVQSAVREMVSGSLTNLNNIVNVTLGVNVKFSGYTDFGAQAGLDHIIRIPRVLGGVIVLDPGINGFAGTQNFTKTAWQQKNFLVFPVAEEEVTTTTRRFNLLSYELSMPVVYGYKKLNLIFTPSYVLPRNLITVAGQPALSERGANLFYVTATVKITL